MAAWLYFAAPTAGSTVSDSSKTGGRNASSGLSVGLWIGFWQVLIAVAGALFWGWIDGGRAALAAASGGAIAVISTLYFAMHAFAHGRDATPQRRLGNLVIGQVMKWVITLGLFGLAIALFRDVFPPVISVYAACLLAYFIALGQTATAWQN